jgi:hypothetical protein
MRNPKAFAGSSLFMDSAMGWRFASGPWHCD